MKHLLTLFFTHTTTKFLMAWVGWVIGKGKKAEQRKNGRSREEMKKMHLSASKV